MTATPIDAPDPDVAATLALIGRVKPSEIQADGTAPSTEAARAMLAILGAVEPARSERQAPPPGAEAVASEFVLPALPPTQRRRRIAFKVAAVSSMLLHAGTLLALLGWLGPNEVGAIPQPSGAVSVEMVASRTLEALQPKATPELAPSPEATAPVEGTTEASEASAAKAEPAPERQVVEPSPAPVPDARDEPARATRRGEPAKAPPQPVPVKVLAEPVHEPPKAKVPDEEDVQAKRKDEKIERNVRAPKGGVTSKAKRGKGTGSGRTSASRGSILTYTALVRARVAANKPSGGGLRGTAMVAFGLTPSGGLAYVSLTRSSGNAALDRLALAAVRRSAPFPAPPAGATSAQLRISIPFHFQ